MTTSTLQRAMPTELQILVWSGQLRKTTFYEYSAIRLLSNAVCCVRNAKNRDSSAMGRFFMANEGIHSLCLGVLYLHGLLPTGLVGHRSMTMQVGCEQMHLPHALRDQILYANTHRELISYGSTEPVEEDEASHLTVLGDAAITQARYVFPDWFM
jgi:hypothetical protein